MLQKGRVKNNKSPYIDFDLVVALNGPLLSLLALFDRSLPGFIVRQFCSLTLSGGLPNRVSDLPTEFFLNDKPHDMIIYQPYLPL